MSELQKKLKQRIKQQKSEQKKTSSYTEASNIKFRRPKELVVSKKKKAANAPKRKKVVKPALKPQEVQEAQAAAIDEEMGLSVQIECEEKVPTQSAANLSKHEEVLMLPKPISQNLITVDEHTLSNLSGNKRKKVEAVP